MSCARCGKPLDEGEAIITADRDTVCEECYCDNDTHTNMKRRKRENGEYISVE